MKMYKVRCGCHVGEFMISLRNAFAGCFQDTLCEEMTSMLRDRLAGNGLNEWKT